MVLLWLILLGGLFALWVSNRDLKRRLEQLEQRLDGDGLVIERGPAPPAAPEVPFTVGYTPVPAAPAERRAEPAVEPEPDEAAWEPEPERETLGVLFERWSRRMLIGRRHRFDPAAVFLIAIRSRSAGDPKLRMIAAAVFGLLLAGSANMPDGVRRRPAISQATVGAVLTSSNDHFGAGARPPTRDRVGADVAVTAGRRPVAATGAAAIMVLTADSDDVRVGIPMPRGAFARYLALPTPIS